MLLHPPDVSHRGQLYCSLLPPEREARDAKKQRESASLTLGPIPTSKIVLYVHLWLIMTSQKLEDKHFLPFSVVYDNGVDCSYHPFPAFPQPLLLCLPTSSLYSGKSFILSLVSLIHAAGRETSPDKRTETLQDRKEKQLLVTKTESLIIFL